MTTKYAFSPGGLADSPGGPAGGRHDRSHRGTRRDDPRDDRDGQAYTEARSQHGESALLDEIVAAKPNVERSRFHSPDELREHGLAQLRAADSLVGDATTSEELDDYRRFVVTLASNVAEAHREHGQKVSPAEEQAIQEITSAVGAASG